MARFIIEGEWSRTGGETKVVHREVTTSKSLIGFVQRTFGIVFSDGTTLFLTCRPATLRERIVPKPGYSTLIRDCARYDVTSVDALVAAQKAERSGTGAD